MYCELIFPGMEINPPRKSPSVENGSLSEEKRTPPPSRAAISSFIGLSGSLPLPQNSALSHRAQERR